ncbi:hypothetical protein CLAFUW4_12651 [Fulvia fulva]|uniref:Uncharacterized protein n=1 Tax=Passalora fulva TaxID=5499 RepID=A0A9Q8UV70_PASFU|nr:uncharacterized protein CLAFUR5_12519 [Fulvia fulva]KAK4611965.1 hypothetical protein CLAFUR4_12656 [Fulvia fulva]KAK4612925.1 hypothetical protein CLAFUR0_12667 [Fulvia fulva]UJO23562.1 hypothetical protein CLAFUR5_12519 [Fulvia fulva]WPV20964.1 hypothetical protein CLAFUW4_12651 [Fulvia fulva]WPV35797.1 hypothetical protein CLAFUW7_12658 [Fulvia fulva]
MLSAFLVQLLLNIDATTTKHHHLQASRNPKPTGNTTPNMANTNTLKPTTFRLLDLPDELTRRWLRAIGSENRRPLRTVTIIWNRADAEDVAATYVQESCAYCRRGCCGLEMRGEACRLGI